MLARLAECWRLVVLALLVMGGVVGAGRGDEGTTGADVWNSPYATGELLVRFEAKEGERVRSVSILGTPYNGTKLSNSLS